MRIISKFRDYYDSAMAYGQDETVVYLRETKHFNLSTKDYPTIIKQLSDLFDKLYQREEFASWRYGRNELTSFTTKTHRYTVDKVRLLFCGKNYPGAVIKEEPLGVAHPAKQIYFWDGRELLDFLIRHGVDAEKKGGCARWSRASIADKIYNHFKANQPDTNWMVENKVTCVLQEGYDLYINPCLKDYQFFKKFDAFSAYQELDMWMSGTLAWPQNMMVEIEDKYRIEQHGFDMEYGFRKRPEAR